MATTHDQTSVTIPSPSTGEPFPPPAEAPPAVAADDLAEEAPWRGVYAPELPRKILPVKFPSAPIVLERKPITPNFSFLPEHDGNE
jgi:hypothetical protein